ncbi:hypothetical protein [Paracoccus aerodenitrificans]|uniref:hypothetical protein n=1 Tax=Paracoccus aerodenitrificans TaxID=3017781 RepID=UPI0022F0DDBF|nr:hypothetical protein [Paracoccus aerodenitrificans]WBU63538.1 hypothetical protein PAE61_14415 [Paracoccus aerodenitrificans]
MTKTRLCLIGNSHLAAMKLGWDKLVEENDPLINGHSITCYGAPRDMLRHVEVRDGCLVPTSPKVRKQFTMLSGQERLDPNDYDVFLLVGLGASFKRVLRLYNGCRWPGVGKQPHMPLVSSDFARSLLIEGYLGTRLSDMGQKLMSVTNKPVFALHEPLWSPRTSPCPGDHDFGWLNAVASGDGTALAALFRDSLAAAIAPWVCLLPQPDSTIEEHIMTRPEFNRDADKDISGSGGGKDAAHMNRDFGAEMWRHHLGAMRP